MALVRSGAQGLGLLCLVIGALAAVRLSARLVGTWLCLTSIFLLFHALYGLSGPVAVFANAPLPSIFARPYHTQVYLTEFGLATLGIVFGLSLASMVGVLRPGWYAPVQRRSGGSFQTGILVIALGSLMEVINCARAGGLTLILQGKATYAGAVDALMLTLPSTQVVSLGIAVAALAFAEAPRHKPRLRRIDLVYSLAAITPILAIVAVLGDRSIMIEWLLVAVVGGLYATPVSRVSWTMGGSLVVLYLASGLLYANRYVIGVGFITGDWEQVWVAARSPNHMALALNPAATEFGAAFGNFSDYVARPLGELKLGSSYIKALTLPIPSVLYPGKKPKQLIYEFRDQYFASLAASGAIAGTAYSSLLESYVNFGVLGAALVYLLLGIALAFCERIRRRSPSRSLKLGYLLLLSSAVAFHRSDFSLIAGNVAMMAFVISLYLFCRAALMYLIVSTPHGRRIGIDGTDGPLARPDRSY